MDIQFYLSFEFFLSNYFWGIMVCRGPLHIYHSAQTKQWTIAEAIEII